MNSDERRTYLQLKYGKVDFSWNFVDGLPEELCSMIHKKIYPVNMHFLKNTHAALGVLFRMERSAAENGNASKRYHAELIERIEEVIEEYDNQQRNR